MPIYSTMKNQPGKEARHFPAYFAQSRGETGIGLRLRTTASEVSLLLRSAGTTKNTNSLVLKLLGRLYWKKTAVCYNELFFALLYWVYIISSALSIFI